MDRRPSAVRSRSCRSDCIQVLIRDTSGLTFEVRAKPQDSVGIIKDRIEVIEGTPACQQHLVYGGRDLRNNARLCDCGIGNRSELWIVRWTTPEPYYESPCIEIFIETADGRRFSCTDVSRRAPVDVLMEQVADATGIPLPQRLLFNRMQLQVGRTLSDYNISGGDVIYLVVA